MSTDLDNRLKNLKNKVQQKQNLSQHERDGLKWLTKEVKENRLAIALADKGGATLGLIVYPYLLRKKVLEKFENESCYEKVTRDDPTRKLHNDLIQLWVKGKNNNFISPQDARKTLMGI